MAQAENHVSPMRDRRLNRLAPLSDPRSSPPKRRHMRKEPPVQQVSVSPVLNAPLQASFWAPTRPLVCSWHYSGVWDAHWRRELFDRRAKRDRLFGTPGQGPSGCRRSPAVLLQVRAGEKHAQQTRSSTHRRHRAINASRAQGVNCDRS